MSLKGRAAITGIGELKPERETHGKTTLGILAEAARLAIEDAGLEKDAVDGLLVPPMPLDTPMIVPATAAEYLSLQGMAKLLEVIQLVQKRLNPALKIGFQIAETIAAHQNTNRRESYQRARDVLQRVGLSPYVMDQYAHELSGGMLQRVMIGLALSCNPDLMLADEPTSALDVTIQKDILHLLKELSNLSRTAMLFITHDLVLVGQTCDEVVVMYAGTVVERGSTEAVLRRSFHPYTKALVNAIPTIDRRKNYLEEIEGNLPDLLLRPPGCPFASRCKERIADLCTSVVPGETRLEPGHYTRCHLATHHGGSSVSGRAIQEHHPLNGSPDAA